MIRGATFRAVAFAVVLTAVLGACLTDAPPPSVVPTPTVEPEATPTVTRYDLGTTVWYGGLVLTFGSATATIDEKGGPVVVGLSLENPGPDDATLDGPIRLAAGAGGLEPSRESVLPVVPAGAVSTTTLTFDVGPAFDVPASAIFVGRSGEHQAIVPLAPGATQLVTLEPVIFAMAVEGQAGELFVKLHQVELRADLPDWNEELARGLMAVTVTYDATFRSTFVGGFAFTTENLGLLLPDGTTIAARADGRSAPAVVIGPKQVVTGLTSRFEVPAPGIGPYKLIVRDGAATTQLELDIAGA